MTRHVPVLMYHSVSEHPPTATRRLSVHPREFDAQLRLLRREGFTAVPFGEYAAALTGGTPLPERTVVLTFDDGYADFHEQALPVLDAHGFTATVFVTTGWLDDAGDDAAGRPLDRMLSWSQVRELDSAGVEIGAHSHSHAQLDQLPSRAVEEELRRSKELLEERTGRQVSTLAYPFGYSSRRVRDAVAAAGYRHAAAVANRMPSARPDPMALPRLTVRRSTDLGLFERIVRGQGIHRAYALDRALTHGWAVGRRTRYAVNALRGKV
jgi:peptidoglycan/xylan/chitin deacetylase (PgdA/CDA1 family)